MKKLLTTFVFLVVYSGLMSQTTTDHIHIDQFGYLPSANKVAVISNPQVGFNSNETYVPGTTLEVVNAGSGQVVFSASPVAWNGGNVHDQSGDQGWWFDFSSVTTPGSYYINDPQNNSISYTFEINDDVYRDILKAAGRMFFYNRCNMAKAAPYAETNWVDGDNFRNPLQDANCRYVNDPNNAALEKDLTGGWFDAGDYNKYVTFASTVIHDLLNAFQENPDVFGDDWNIPETGNGIPDVLDEVIWELEWLKKMQTATGEVHIKMGSISYSENVSAPPSLNVDPRYYGPTCSSSTIAVAGMFAHASMTFSTVTGLTTEAGILKNLAELSWNAVIDDLNNSTLDLECDDGTIKAGDADRSVEQQREEALLAAIYLYEITGSSTYGDYISNNIMDATSVAGNWWGPYTEHINEGLLRYTTLANANSTLSSTIINSLTPHVQQDWNGFYGMNNDDLYRAFMPEWSYHWGSNKVKAQYGIINQSCIRYNINPSGNASYAQKAEEQLHYYHGVNPMNLVYLSNMYSYGAEKSANEIYHTWFHDGTDWDNALTSPYGPAPGFVSGGANKDYSYAPMSPPYGQPDQKSYLDFNDSNPEKSWEITEPAIYYQAAYIRLLSYYAPPANSGSVPVTLSAFTVKKENDDVQLEWTTASEVNTKEIIIERSEDATNWTVAGQKDAAGNVSTPTEYQFLDVNPWNSANTLYYRLKFVDLDGEFSFSETKSVSRTVSGIDQYESEQIIFYPNPAKDLLQLVHPDPVDDLQVFIFDARGANVKTLRLKQSTIAIDELPPGMYTLVLESEGEFWKERFVKL